jgi:hypothetical protein
VADNSSRLDALGSSESIASDDISGVQYQRVKLTVGADGAAGDVEPPDSDGQSAASVLPAGAMLFGTGGTFNRWQDASAQGDGGFTTGVGLPTVGNRLYNGTNFDREYGNMSGVLLASAARTTTTSSASQTNYNHRGVIVHLDVTSAGTGTLQVQINGTSGIGAFVLALGTASAGSNLLIAYPGVIDADTSYDAKSVVLTRVWTVTINKSDASSWTYSVGYALIV